MSATQSPDPSLQPHPFEEAFDAFEKANVERSKGWSAIFSAFDQQFEAARQDRAIYTPRLNVLEVFGLKTRELCHSRVLEWFLDENATHEQGNIFAMAFLRYLGLIVPECSKYSVQREKPDRVDLACFKRGSFAVFVENKVKHHERELQLADLQDSLIALSEQESVPESNRVAVFLTDDGRPPKSAHTQPLKGFLNQNLQAVRRCELFSAFRDALASQGSKSPLLVGFVDAYLAGIATH